MIGLFRTFQCRLLFFFLGLILFVQVIAFFSIDAANTQSALLQIKNELFVGGRVFDRLIKARTEHLFEAARLLSGDFAFKTAFSTGERPTLISAMDNHRERIKADVIMLASLEHKLIADTLNPEAKSDQFVFPDLIRKAEEKGEASSVVFIGDHPYQVVVVPLLAPEPVAWICIGFTIDDLLAKDLQTLTRLEVTFTRERQGQRPVALASTLPDPLRKSLTDSLPSTSWQSDMVAVMSMNGSKYVSLSSNMGKSADADVVVILQRPMEEALEQFYRLRKLLIVLYLAGLIVSLAGGTIIAGTVTKPVRLLAEAARFIEDGDYGHSVTVVQQDELGKLASAFNHMSSAIAKREEQIKYQAYHDNLTGLSNRSFLLKRLNEEIPAAMERGGAFALIIMDLDRFKDINAVLGHATGDTILKKIGPVLTEAVPEAAAVVRMGGDEFALLVPDINNAGQARDVTLNISKKLESPFIVDGNPIQVESSFGIVLFPEHGEDADTLLKLADVALYTAKGSVNGYAVYSPELVQHNLKQLTLLGELRLAIENEEMVFFYQPKVNITSGHVVGMEALIRWEHPRHGFIPPDDFIPLLEGTALIKPMTMWTLRTAFDQCSQLNNMGITLDMSVNLSARMLQDPRIPELVLQMTKDYSLPPQQIIIEVTESAVMTDPQKTLDTIKRLDETGVRLSIDDFGTGYSSMSYLQKLPVDELKIDKSFVLNVHKNPNDAKIVHSIIGLGHNLGMKVVSEGVETQAAWDLLKYLGCDIGQGYFMSKPLPIAGLVTWLKESGWGLR
ncbi:MAG: EAL domain-containing protein [Nitrospirae bacterium]|nr:EAL domain-containing protein [Nitrospirota bacterium]